MIHGLISMILAAMSLFHQAQAAPTPTPTLVSVVESSGEQTAPAVAEFREPVAEPAPPVAALPANAWPTLADREFAFCLLDAGGYAETNDKATDQWVIDNVAAYWGVTAVIDCQWPELAIVIDASVPDDWCGWALRNGAKNEEGRATGLIHLAPDCFLENTYSSDSGETLNDVGTRTLLHEFGHIAGLGHGDAPSVMYPVTVYLPNASDRAALAEIYNWPN